MLSIQIAVVDAKVSKLLLLLLLMLKHATIIVLLSTQFDSAVVLLSTQVVALAAEAPKMMLSAHVATLIYT